MEKPTILKDSNFWVALTIILVTTGLSVATFLRWFNLRFQIGPYYFTHWLSWIGTLFIAIYTPIYYARATPIWASNMSSPMRAFLTEYENKISKIAIFCTGDGDKPEKVFNSISEFLGKEPLSTLGLIGPDRDEMVASLKIQEFVANLIE
jgi:hypothetical protein